MSAKMPPFTLIFLGFVYGDFACFFRHGFS